MVQTATLGTTKQLTFTVGRSDKKFCCANTWSIVDDALRAHMSLVCQQGFNNLFKMLIKYLDVG